MMMKHTKLLNKQMDILMLHEYVCLNELEITDMKYALIHTQLKCFILRNTSHTHSLDRAHSHTDECMNSDRCTNTLITLWPKKICWAYRATD